MKRYFNYSSCLRTLWELRERLGFRSSVRVGLCGLWLNFFPLAFLLVFLGTGSLFSAENRHALVIGNGAYQDKDISKLVNPVNDAADVAVALKELDYNVTLKTDITLREMLGAVRVFVAELKKSPENEGFFWFAGHGLSVNGVHYLLPVDVDPYDDDSIPRTSFSVDDLMSEIEKAGNVTNLIVIDACRNNVIPGSRSVSGRGLTVMSRDDYRVRGNKLVYSTMAGSVAADAVAGGRNSPFAQAFISKIKTPEPFDDVFLDIANETLSLTKGQQEPYSMGSFAVKSYMLSLAARDLQAAQAAEVQAAIQAALAGVTVKIKRDYSKYNLDDKKVMSLSVSANAYPSTFTEGGFGAGASFTFFEKYRKYGEFFYIPNSFYASADFYMDTQKVKSQLYFMGDDGQERYTGGIVGVGALYKIRIGEKQRFLVNFGPSLEMFLAQAQFYYGSERRYYSDGGPKETRFLVMPGIGVHAGLSFRLSSFVSMDFNVAFRQVFVRTKEITLSAVMDGGGAIGSFEFNKGVFPYTIGGNLGITLWWPK